VHYLTLLSILALMLSSSLAQAAEPAKKIPIILDADLGDDIDDTWALMMVLRSPELDLKLFVTDYHNARYRARIAAKFLTIAGRTDVPIGLGLRPDDKKGNQSAWIEGYDLKSYPGKVHEDGVQAMIDTIMASPEQITLLCIGPVPNIAEALKREPRIAQKARFVGMHGSVRKGYGNQTQIAAEWNVRCNPAALQAVFAAPWDKTITPLDTCGIVQLKGEKYAKIRDSKGPLTVALIENFRAWATSLKKPDQPNRESSILFDTVAVYLAFSTDLLKMEKLPIRVTDDGKTVIDEQNGHMMNVATEWKDLKAFEDLLVERLK
jgi:inosine-uridine nucleoside N-ribohydrolase